MTKVVNEVTPETMDGSNELEKEINAYLTTHFIASKEIPSDECLSEAKDIIKIVVRYQHNSKSIVTDGLK